MNKNADYFEQVKPAYYQAAVDQDFLISLDRDAEQIAIFVQQVADAALSCGYNALRDQVKTYTADFPAQDVLVSELPPGVSVQPSPRLEQFSGHKDLKSMKMYELTAE